MKTELIAECKVNACRNSLSIQIFRSGNAYVCERRQLERDGTESTQLLPFRTAEALQTFIKSDSYYREYPRTLDTITSAMWKYLHG